MDQTHGAVKERNVCRHPLQISPSSQVNSPGTTAARAVTMLAVAASGIALVASIAPAISGGRPAGNSADPLGTDSVSAAALVVVFPAYFADHTNRLYEHSAILYETHCGKKESVQ